MLNAVGIDISKGKSTVTVLQPGGVSLRKPFDVTHSFSGLNGLKDYVFSLDDDTRAVMEYTRPPIPTPWNWPAREGGTDNGRKEMLFCP